MLRSKLLVAASIAALVLAACTPAAQPSPPAATQPAAAPTTAPAASPTEAMAAQATPTVPIAGGPMTVGTPTAPAAGTPMAPAMGTPAAGGVIIQSTDDPELGTILTDAEGMVLYMYTRDEPNVSNCYDQCATNWPPLLVEDGEPMLASGLEGELGVTERTDGTRQVTFNEMPLYYWARDTQPGDTTGQNVGGVWFVVHPGTDSFPTVKTAPNEELGTILTDLEGMTLYIFTRDEPGVSNCYDQCATNWPPLTIDEGEPVLAGGVPGELGVIERTDGTRQVTYNEMPLYYWVNDSEPGDTTGQGVNDVWFVVEPAESQ